MTRHLYFSRLLLATGIFAVICPAAQAQDRLKKMPGYEHFQKLGSEIPNSIQFESIAGINWRDDSKMFEFQKNGKFYRYDIEAKKLESIATPTLTAPAAPQQGAFDPSWFVERGRQAASATSPDGKFKAFYRDFNLWLSDAEGVLEQAVTSDGNAKDRVKNGSGSWVYGEELGQTTAMWWSPDSTKVAFYRFDESKVPNYYLALDQTQLRSRVDTEAYPKPGDPNPLVELFIYDIRKKTTVKVDVRSGGPFTDASIGHYVYRISWAADSSELLFTRANRRQNEMELVAANAETGKCRVILRESWPTGWITNSPYMQFLADKKRFIWASERTGWRNFYLYHLDGTLLATLTKHEFEVADVQRIDEKAGHLYYMARSGDNPMKVQLHRVGMDGEGDQRLTDPAFYHTVNIAPDGKHLIDVIQTHDLPPVTRLVDTEGNVLEELAKCDMTQFKKLGLNPVELLTYKAADGETDLYGLLYKPSTFDPKKKYPLLVSVYAGPETNGARETYVLPSVLSELGYLVAMFDSRSASGRGKRFLDSIYMKLGRTEIDDQAAGVKSLWDRPYLDKNRVGMFGTSYGGSTSILCLLRHPDVFHAAAASSAVTDWRNYDTIYTERYMWLPEENKEGYDAANAMNHVSQLRGRLMLFFGTVDNNVHPSNTLQLISALQNAGKGFDVQVGPDRGHESLERERMMEFFIDNLGTVDQPPKVQ